MTVPSVSVVIPTLNAGLEIRPLLMRLLSQTVMPSEILVIDSQSEDGTAEEVRDVVSDEGSGLVRLVEIERSEFDHGGTRRRAVAETSGDLVLFLTQDAMPVGGSYIERLTAPFSDARVAIASGRQVARPDAVRFERLVREFNYPRTSHVRSKDDLPEYGIKTYFTSDVCSAYRRTAYDELGGFPARCNTSEDMYLAICAIERGWSIAYAADAEVIHSHNLTPAQQFRRNREVGYFLQTQEGRLSQASEVGEGSRLVRSVAAQLIREGEVGQLLAFGIDCAARLAGNRCGRTTAKKDMKRE